MDERSVNNTPEKRNGEKRMKGERERDSETETERERGGEKNNSEIRRHHTSEVRIDSGVSEAPVW